MEDQRFSCVKNDAKFRKIPKKSQKVKIDSRFQSMFKDKKFKVEYTVDERGRPFKHSTTGDLKRYYHLSSSEGSSSESEEEDEEKKPEDSESEKEIEDTGEPEKETEVKLDKKPKKTIPEDVKTKLKNLGVDYARGEQALFSESSSDEEQSENEDDDEEIEHKWGELDAETETTEEPTNRLAACNMDWDRIRATDIMVVLNSFVPAGGKIESVKIYVSEFGKQRLAEEDISGPPELRATELDDEDEDNEEGSKYHMEKLRQYQLNRLKYYYAVVTFSDVNTANHVYTECDGMEYESSSTKLDLRFIPNDMEFDEEPKEVCDKLPEMTKYQPKFFVTTALQQAKVNLTWDETNPERIELTQKINKGKLDEVDENELKNYLALSDDDESESDESENDDKNDDSVEKYKALLMDIEEKEKEKQSRDIQMEVTWGLDMEKKSEALVKKKIAEKEEKTPFQQFLDKRKEKRKEKKKNRKENNSDDDDDIPSDIDMNDPYFAEEFKGAEFAKKKKQKSKPVEDEDDKQKQAELELLLMNEDSEKKHFSLKKIQEQGETKKSKKNKKNKKEQFEKEDDFEVNVGDARFSAIFSSHHYNIDPSDSHYKKTQGMEKLISEKLKRRAESSNEVCKKSKLESGKKRNAELSVLVKSVKRKTEAINKNK